jgi:hypothetical protein
MDTLKIIQSFNISFSGTFSITVQHFLSGLKPGTILTSIQSGLSWKVSSRTIYKKISNQIHFEGEKEIYSLGSFVGNDSSETFAKYIIERERNNIFNYEVEPINHSEGPTENENLYIN